VQGLEGVAGSRAEVRLDHGRATDGRLRRFRRRFVAARRGRLNYRHHFHAGNFADLVKHAVLLAALVA
jgi:hypothetical protein